MSKEKRTFSSLTLSDKKEFKRRYLEGESVNSLAEEFRVKRTSAQYYANKEWKQEKALMRAELFQKFSEDKKENFIKMSNASIIIMTRALQELAKRDQPPSIAEAKRATEILESLDKISRLDENKPTEITEERPITTVELKERLSIDPFSGVTEEVDYKELPDAKETN